MKNKLKLENIIYVFVILCPILDIVSFIFRNTFNTKISPSTIIRPLIPTLVILWLFIKKDKKFKRDLLIIGAIYVIYALIHIYLFSKVKTGMSFGTETHELQYAINYTFMIINLIIFTTVFKEDNIDIVWCPGAFEIPLIASKMAKSGKYDAVICLGAVIRGATSHYDYVCNEVSKGIAHVSLESEIPVMFGVVTTENIEQAIERAGTKAGNKGYDCALGAIEMVNLIREIEA